MLREYLTWRLANITAFDVAVLAVVLSCLVYATGESLWLIVRAWLDEKPVELPARAMARLPEPAQVCPWPGPTVRPRVAAVVDFERYRVGQEPGGGE
ncbi:MAG: hypothetical protein AB7G23_02895 [Vicinamibacterales bacterium]